MESGYFVNCRYFQRVICVSGIDPRIRLHLVLMGQRMPEIDGPEWERFQVNSVCVLPSRKKRDRVDFWSCFL